MRYRWNRTLGTILAVDRGSCGLINVESKLCRHDEHKSNRRNSDLRTPTRWPATRLQRASVTFLLPSSLLALREISHASRIDSSNNMDDESAEIELVSS